MANCYTKQSYFLNYGSEVQTLKVKIFGIQLLVSVCQWNWFGVEVWHDRDPLLFFPLSEWVWVRTAHFIPCFYTEKGRLHLLLISFSVSPTDGWKSLKADISCHCFLNLSLFPFSFTKWDVNCLFSTKQSPSVSLSVWAPNCLRLLTLLSIPPMLHW